MRRKRLLKDYVALFRNPLHMVPPSANSDGVRVVLWPNGEPEIWIATQGRNDGIRLRFSSGPHGLGLTASTFVGTEPMTITSGDLPMPDETSTTIEICQYLPTPAAQAYRRWCLQRETPDDVAVLGSEYAR